LQEWQFQESANQILFFDQLQTMQVWRAVVVVDWK
jgi:hypothetical protein